MLLTFFQAYFFKTRQKENKSRSTHKETDRCRYLSFHINFIFPQSSLLCIFVSEDFFLLQPHTVLKASHSLLLPWALHSCDISVIVFLPILFKYPHLYNRLSSRASKILCWILIISPIFGFIISFLSSSKISSLWPIINLLCVYLVASPYKSTLYTNHLKVAVLLLILKCLGYNWI